MLRRFPAPSTEGAAFYLAGRKCGGAAPATGERRTARQRERVDKIAQAKTTVERPRRREGGKLFFSYTVPSVDPAFFVGATPSPNKYKIKVK